MSYNVIQKTGDTQSEITNSKELISWPSVNYNQGKTDFQQLVYYPGDNISFSPGQVYYVELEIPENKNFNLNFDARLVTVTENSPINLREDNTFQFIKVISIPQYNTAGTDINEVWLYHIIDSAERPSGSTDPYIEDPITHIKDYNVGTYDGVNKKIIVNAAVAVKIPYSANGLESYINEKFSVTQRKNKIFYSHDSNESNPLKDIIYLCDNDGVIIKENEQPKDFYSCLEKTKVSLSQAFYEEETSQKIKRRFIFAPEAGTSYNAIFFYLQPIAEDNNLQWQDNNQHQMIGRKINVDNTRCGHIALTNIITNDISNIKNISIWGRSEQLIAINGQELKLGPSGYLELKDYDIDSLYIATPEETDKYIVDIQYENN